MSSPRHTETHNQRRWVGLNVGEPSTLDCRSLLAGDFVARTVQPVSNGTADSKVRVSLVHRLEAGSYIWRGFPAGFFAALSMTSREISISL